MPTKRAAATPPAQSMLESSLRCGPLLSPLIHNLNLPLLDVLSLGACPEEGGEAQKKTAVSHGGGQINNDGWGGFASGGTTFI